MPAPLNTQPLLHPISCTLKPSAVPSLQVRLFLSLFLSLSLSRSVSRSLIWLLNGMVLVVGVQSCALVLCCVDS